MKTPIGISLEIGRDDKGWFTYLGKLKLLKVRPSRDGIDARYGGFKFDLLAGTMRRPIPRFWKREFWSQDYMTKEPATNPWNSGNHWFVLTLPCFGFFISVCYGKGKRQPGFYFGLKTYEVNEISQGLGRYDIGDPQKCLVKYPYPNNVAWGSPDEVGDINLGLSGSIRDDLVD